MNKQLTGVAIASVAILILVLGISIPLKTDHIIYYCGEFEKDQTARLDLIQGETISNILEPDTSSDCMIEPRTVTYRQYIL